MRHDGRKYRFVCATALCSFALAPAATAQSTDARIADLREQVSDLQSRIDGIETQPEPRISTDQDNVRLTFGGRINQSLLFASQGDSDEAFIADNDASGSRLEFLAETDVDDITAGLELVISAEANSTDEIDFGNTVAAEDGDNALGDFRQAHAYIEGGFGYFSIGQGDTAAEDSAHVDLSGTDFAGSGSDVDDIAGGLFFTTEDGIELTELDDFFDMQDGSRALRVLYETPGFSGFTLKGSLQNDAESLDGDDDEREGSGLSPSIGIAFAREFGGTAFEAEASYRRETFAGENGDDVDESFVVGSASMLLESGLNFTVAASQGNLESSNVDDPNAYFAKVGYIVNFIDLGETRFSLDYFRGENAPDFASPGGDLPEATSYGLFAVQDYAALNAEFYAGVRVYELDGVHVDGGEVDVDDMTAVIVGTRVRF